LPSIGLVPGAFFDIDIDIDIVERRASSVERRASSVAGRVAISICSCNWHFL